MSTRTHGDIRPQRLRRSRFRATLVTIRAMADRTTVKRLPDRGAYDRETIDAILAEGLICHVGFVQDGYPVVIPTIHARVGDTLYLHGSAASRMLRNLRDEPEVCVTVTIVDGVVAARSLFNHSMNYRSVVVFGTAREVTDPEERTVALKAVADHILPGRWDDARLPNRNEDKATLLIAVSLDEVSAKVRTGPPNDDEEDYDLEVWAGVIPLSQLAGPPEADPLLASHIPVPSYVTGYRR